MRAIHLDVCCGGFAKVSLSDTSLTACNPADMPQGGETDKRNSKMTPICTGYTNQSLITIK